MTNKDAIEIRKSRRKYLATPIATPIIGKLEQLIEEYNKKENLNIQLILDNSEVFNSFKKSYGILTGVQHYIALVGKQSDNDRKEKLGYYGELLTLAATKEGLGTCWVGLTFDKEACVCNVNSDETFECIIAIGNIESNLSLKENLIQKASHLKSKTANDLYRSDTTPPNHFLEGIRLVQKAPSGQNKLPIMFQYLNGHTSASITNTTGYEHIDLGIAKLHFELGAGGGHWTWGDNGLFEYID